MLKSRSLGLFFFVASMFLSITPISAAQHPLVIYGTDDRIEVFEEIDPDRRALADSVVAIMSSNVIESELRGVTKLKGENYRDYFQLCSTERFVDQYTLADCTGVLVADDIIATAGHCAEGPDFCKDSQIIFGYMYDSKTRDPMSVRSEDVYRCKKVLKQVLNTTDGTDFALVQLDRVVSGHKPLPIAKRSPAPTDSVFMIGNPVGLPTKISPGASVRNTGSIFYTASLDSFSGNSGSPVFNLQNEVAGLLVRGQGDFVKKGKCYISKRCKDSGCDGEDVTNPEIFGDELEKILLSRP